MKLLYKHITEFLFYLLSFLLIIIWTAVGYTVFSRLVSTPQEEAEETELTQGIMLMIEFEDMEGLENFVYQLNERDIPSILQIMPSFAEEHKEEILALQDYDVEIIGVYPVEPLWDVPYEEQFEIIKQTKDAIESITGKTMRAFGSKYFAYDENTIRAAEMLGIEYVFARGTTGAKATIYKPEEYDVKIFSVSNVSSENWGTGSLCDYSYWAREGNATDFEEELFKSLNYPKISPVSHTYIGGIKKSWNDAYLNFFDNSEVEWVNLDTFGKIDITLPFEEIPENREVQYDTPKPAIPLDEEENVSNPCAITDYSENTQASGEYVGNKIVMYHNGSGPMCLEAKTFVDKLDYEVEEHLTLESDFYENLEALKGIYKSSSGESPNFGYYPIIFIQDKAFSGFNSEIEKDILLLIE